MNVLQNRWSGLLFHPTCLPNQVDGIGTLGEEAYRFIDWLCATGQHLWQILPLNPTGFADSPYASFSAFAGNPYLIDLQDLRKEGDLSDEDLESYRPPQGSNERVNYGWLYENKFGVLRKAFENFKIRKKGRRHHAFEKFCEANLNWLEDYSLFMAIKESRGGQSWDGWEPELRSHGKLANLEGYIIKEDYEFHRYAQWLFFEQWMKLKKYANQKGIRIIGDAPIFVAYDSSDVWSHQMQFYLDKDGKPTVVAGVPPDYFSETGQLWGNPLYKWGTMKENGYQWWIDRLQNLLKLVDIIRIDHFRGFAQYWEVDANETTAINGTWVDGPGEDFFQTLVNTFKGELPIIAEDLGLITPDVEKLRDDFNLPGMKILEFAPWGEEHFLVDAVEFEFKVHRYLPENYPKNCVAYLGTHDNDTFVSWFHNLNEEQKAHVMEYLEETDERALRWSAISRLWESDANLVIVSVQDMLGLGYEARLNTPGTCGEHNWSWRLADLELLNNDGFPERLQQMTAACGRTSKQHC